MKISAGPYEFTIDDSGVLHAALRKTPDDRGASGTCDCERLRAVNAAVVTVLHRARQHLLTRSDPTEVIRYMDRAIVHADELNDTHEKVAICGCERLRAVNAKLLAAAKRVIAEFRNDLFDNSRGYEMCCMAIAHAEKLEEPNADGK